MQNLNPTRIIARRGRDIMLIGALFLLGGLVVSGFGLLILIVAGSNIIGILVGIIGLVLLIVGIGFIIRGLTYRRDNEIARVVGDTLARELDEKYVFIRNLSRNRLGYLDALLLGPSGALVFRVTDANGIYLNEGADWLERKGGETFTLSRNNWTRECVTDVYALRNYLGRRGLGEIPVYGVVVFTNSQTQVSTRQPVVPVAELRTLMVVLRREYLAETRVTDDKVQAATKAVYDL